MTPAEALEKWQAYLDLKAAVATADDIQVYIQHGQPHNFYKKSYWRKMARFFSLSVEYIEGTERTVKLPGDGQYAVTVKYRATHPTTRATATGDGHCGTDESGKVLYYQIAGIAHTRAFNRAVSNLVGGGEVSAEEMDSVAGAQPDQPVPHVTLPQPGGAVGAPPPQTKIKFGSCVGMFPRDLSDKDLAWYTRVVGENLHDPEKANFKRMNQVFYRELKDEKDTRELRDKFPPRDVHAGAEPPDNQGPVEPDRRFPFAHFGSFIEGCEKVKHVIGPEAYYEVLRACGNLAHVNECKTGHQMREVWSALSLKSQAAEMDLPRPGDDDIPF